MEQKAIYYYCSGSRKIPYLEWFEIIKDKLIKARIRKRLDRMILGNYGDYKMIGEGLSELRLNFGSGYRIYFTELNNNIMLLCAGNKSTQDSDIQNARFYLKKLKQRINK